MRTLVDTIHESFRRTDYIGRLGGDEFVVLFKGFGSKKTLDKRLARMQEQLREKLPTPVSCSVGITLIRKKTAITMKIVSGRQIKLCIQQSIKERIPIVTGKSQKKIGIDGEKRYML